MSREATKALVRQTDAAANAGDYDTLRRLCTPEFGGDLMRGPTAARAQFGGLFEVVALLAEGDQVALQERREPV